MTMRVNSESPDFTANTTPGEISFHAWTRDCDVILFSQLEDFTPVCTTEIGHRAGFMPKFEKRDYKVIRLSVDLVDGHHAGAKDIEEIQGHVITDPVIPDSNFDVAKLYDMLPAGSGVVTENRTATTMQRLLGVRGRSGQEDQSNADVFNVRALQLRRNTGSVRFLPADSEAPGSHAGEREVW